MAIIDLEKVIAVNQTEHDGAKLYCAKCFDFDDQFDADDSELIYEGEEREDQILICDICDERIA